MRLLNKALECDCNSTSGIFNNSPYTVICRTTAMALQLLSGDHLEQTIQSVLISHWSHISDRLGSLSKGMELINKKSDVGVSVASKYNKKIHFFHCVES